LLPGSIMGEIKIILAMRMFFFNVAGSLPTYFPHTQNNKGGTNSQDKIVGWQNCRPYNIDRAGIDEQNTKKS
jgi:hypothetical protein